MKLWHYIVLVVLILAGVYLYTHRQELGLAGPRAGENAETANAEGTGPRPAHIDWLNLDRSPDGFRVDMPTGYREVHVPAFNEKGGVEQVQMILSNPDENTTFAISWADNPPVVRVSDHSPDHILDMARDDALSRSQTTLESEVHVNPSNYPAREFSAHNAAGGVMNVHLLYTGQRLYMLVAAFPSVGARNEQDVVRFFNSFHMAESNRIPERLDGAPAPRRQ